MQRLFQRAKRLISMCLVTLLIVTSTLTIFPASARAEGDIINTTDCRYTVNSKCDETTVNYPESKHHPEGIGLALAVINSDDSKTLGGIMTVSSAAASLGSIDDSKIVGGIITASSVAAILGSIPVVIFTSPAAGILGVLGFTTTTVVALPAAGIVATAGLAAFGVKKVFFDRTVNAEKAKD
jgi:hypothetical protein